LIDESRSTRMELVHIATSLWRRKLLVAAGALFALLVAIHMLFQVTLWPPGLHRKGTRLGTASAEVMIDAEDSALGDLRRATLPLVDRTAIFARFLGAGGVSRGIARAAGLPESQLAVIGPKLRIDGVPDPESAQRALVEARHAQYLVQVQQGDDLPILTLYSQAPDKATARRLADATVVTLQRFLTSYQDRAGVPASRRTAFRPLGPAQASEVRVTGGAFLPVAAFLFLFGSWCFAILAWPSAVAAWRAEGEPRTQPAPAEQAAVAPPPLPTDDGDADDAEDEAELQRRRLHRALGRT
jgi:hypothetical protein